MLSHHVVIRDGKIANYHPYPPTPWNASPRDIYGTPGPYEDAVQNTPIFEENGPDNFKGIDIMRTVRSFDPVPALRRAHVPGQRQGAGDAPLADLRQPRLRRRPSRAEPGARADAQEHRVRASDGGGRRAGPRLETGSDPATRAAAQELVRRGHGAPPAGLDRMLRSSGGRERRAHDRWTSSPGTSWSRACCCCTTSTRWISRPRVRGALEKTRPVSQVPRRQRGARGIDERGTVRLRLQGQLPRLPILRR